MMALEHSASSGHVVLAMRLLSVVLGVAFSGSVKSSFVGETPLGKVPATGHAKKDKKEKRSSIKVRRFILRTDLILTEQWQYGL